MQTKATTGRIGGFISVCFLTPKRFFFTFCLCVLSACLMGQVTVTYVQPVNGGNDLDITKNYTTLGSDPLSTSCNILHFDLTTSSSLSFPLTFTFNETSGKILARNARAQMNNISLNTVLTNSPSGQITMTQGSPNGIFGVGQTIHLEILVDINCSILGAPTTTSPNTISPPGFTFASSSFRACLRI